MNFLPVLAFTDIHIPKFGTLFGAAISKVIRFLFEMLPLCIIKLSMVCRLFGSIL